MVVGETYDTLAFDYLLIAINGADALRAGTMQDGAWDSAASSAFIANRCQL
jgi:hypothetical protein